MELLPGGQVGPYQIQREIGRGGMGAVFRARDPRLDREVAIKVLPEELAADFDRLRRFSKEAKTLAQISHPNIVQVFDTGMWNGIPYLVMELLDGESLRSWMQGHAISTEKAVELTIQVACGLSAAHSQGIIHRDLKPENVFICRSGVVKILDFGLAKIQEPLPEFEASQISITGIGQSSTGVSVILGTLGYISPEQINGGKLDGRTDLFSLGVMLWELLTGQRPFQGDSAVDTLHAILRTDPPEIPPDLKIPSGLEKVLRRSIQKDLGERFQSAKDFGFALENLSNNSDPKGMQATSPGMMQSPLRRKVFIGTASALLSLLLFLLGRYSFPPAQVRVTQLMDSPFEITAAALMPGNNSVVFTATHGGEREELYRLPEGDRSPISLGLIGYRIAAISSTGDLALVQRNHPSDRGGMNLAIRSSAGGSPRIMVAATGSAKILSAEFGPEGRDLIVMWYAYQGRATTAFTYKGHLLYEAPFGFGTSNFSLSPEKDSIAFIESRPTESTLMDSLVVVSLEGKELSRTQLKNGMEASFTEWSVSSRDLIWIPQGIFTTLLSSAGSMGVGQLMRINPKAGTLQEIPGGGMMGPVLGGSPTGRFLVLSGGFDANSTVVVWQQRESPEPAFLLEGFCHGTCLPLDGGSFLYRSGNRGVYLASEKSSTPIRLASGIPVAISGDGKWAAIQTSDSQNTFSIRLLSCEDGGERNLPGKWASNFGRGSTLSFDGRKLLICGTKVGTASSGSFILDTETGNDTPLEGNVRGPLSRNARWAVRYFSERGMEGPCAVVNTETGRETPLPPTVAKMVPLTWTPDQKGIWLWKKSEPGVPGGSIWLLDLGSQRLNKIREIPLKAGLRLEEGNIPSISGDGRSLAYTATRTFPIRTYLYGLTLE